MPIKSFLFAIESRGQEKLYVGTFYSPIVWILTSTYDVAAKRGSTPQLRVHAEMSTAYIHMEIIVQSQRRDRLTF